MARSSGLQEIHGEHTGEKVGSSGYRCTRRILELRKDVLGVCHTKQLIERERERLLEIKGENKMLLISIFY